MTTRFGLNCGKRITSRRLSAPRSRLPRGFGIERIPQLKSLSSEEKLILVGELWDQLASDPTAFPKRDDHVKILETRLAHLREHPDDVVAWEEVKKRILSSR